MRFFATLTTLLIGAGLCQADIIMWTNGDSGSIPGDPQGRTFKIMSTPIAGITRLESSGTTDGDYSWTPDDGILNPPSENRTYASGGDWTIEICFFESDMTTAATIPLNWLTTLWSAVNSTATNVLTIDGAGAGADLVLDTGFDTSGSNADGSYDDTTSTVTANPATGETIHAHLFGNSSREIGKLKHDIQGPGPTDGTIVAFGFHNVAIPEPSSFAFLAMVGAGLAGLARIRRRRLAH